MERKVKRRVKISKMRGIEVYYLVVDGKKIMRFYFNDWSEKPCIHVYSPRVIYVTVEDYDEECESCRVGGKKVG